MTIITIQAADGGSFSAYLALPARTPAPCVVAIQEIFGVNAEMRAKCDELAAQGYIAICPDLFWRLEPGVELTDQSKAEWDRAFDLMNRFDIDQGVRDLDAAAQFVKGYQGSNGHVGCVGYCLGGRLAFLMACRTGVECSVSYYGVGLEGLVDEAAKIRRPLMLHVAELDKFSPPEAQAKLKAGLKGNRFVTLHSYPGVDHAFARNGGEHYDAGAADIANSRTRDFLRANLGPAR